MYKIILVLFNLLFYTNYVNAQKKPNIIYILADDLGYGDVGCYGQKIIRTPNIDALSKEGILFTQHYAGSTVCAPSRAVLMTGRDVGHSWVRGNYSSGPNDVGNGLELREQDFTIGELLQKRGYTTAMIGKWGLGVTGTTGEPNKKGFNYSYGFLNQAHAHAQFPDYLFRNGIKVDIAENKNEERNLYSNNLFINEALQFVKNNQVKPFFLYLAFTTPHAELLVPNDTIFNSYKGKFEEKPFIKKNPKGKAINNNLGEYNSQEYPKAAYAASITHLDMCIGKLITYLKENNLYNNTLIIFSSDNGPAKEGGANPDNFKSSGQLRGFKRDLYEGGIRVPMIAVWANKIKPGIQTNHISGFQDVMPTLAEVTGKVLPKSVLIEGISFCQTLFGKTQLQKQHAYLYWEFHENKTSSQAILMNRWKGVRLAPDAALELYDLNTDISESNNIANQNSEVVKQIENILQTARTPHELWPLKTKANLIEKANSKN